MGIGEKGLNWGSGIGDKEDKGELVTILFSPSPHHPIAPNPHSLSVVGAPSSPPPHTPHSPHTPHCPPTPQSGDP
jgi:hypothetical protein